MPNATATITSTLVMVSRVRIILGESHDQMIAAFARIKTPANNKAGTNADLRIYETLASIPDLTEKTFFILNDKVDAVTEARAARYGHVLATAACGTKYWAKPLWP
jgi:hypothetical protein